MTQLPYFDSATLSEVLAYPALIEALREAFSLAFEAPVRSCFSLSQKGEQDAQELLLMPSWSKQFIAVKQTTIFPNNPNRGLPAIGGLVTLFDGKNGTPLAVMEAGELTARRTAATSALAADYLAPKGATHLLVIGSGRLIPYLIEAHSMVRPINEITIWARDIKKAEKCLACLPPAISSRCVLRIATSLQDAVGVADIITSATRATKPLIMGEWVKAGAHLDLVGGYKPHMREANKACIEKSSIFVDTYEGALSEAGELIDALASGIIKREQILAQLAELVTGQHIGRRCDEEITLFKSVGSAIEDLAAAALAYQSLVK